MDSRFVSITLRTKVGNYTITSAHAPQSGHDIEDIDQFYLDLGQHLKKQPGLICGDFNVSLHEPTSHMELVGEGQSNRKCRKRGSSSFGRVRCTSGIYPSADPEAEREATCEGKSICPSRRRERVHGCMHG